ncbi:MAG: hypothetical protein COB98_05290 [Flavobacteriaceae bacterium]|nr:MAG: hypothetical protein COB98_05290 [Flavobacteriaceae bacterium]
MGTINKIDKIKLKLSLTLFALSVLYGLLLRLQVVKPIFQFDYNNVLQSHSHVAFLGWGFLSTLIVMQYVFLTTEQRAKKVYCITYWIMFTCIALMLASFVLSGYHLFSIILLTVFGLTSYVFCYEMIKDLKNDTKHLISSKFAKASIYYYVLSSLATWFVAFVVLTQGKTDLYYNAIYFYLHFLYNGFFVFALFGVFFKMLRKKSMIISQRRIKHFYYYTNIACIPAYALSVLWSDVHISLNIIGGIAAVIQLIGLLYLMVIIKQTFIRYSLSNYSRILLMTVMVSYGLKLVAQFLSSFPYFVTKTIELKPYLLIGYLHMVTIGFISFFLLTLIVELRGFYFKPLFPKFGLSLFLAGFFSTEILFFLQGFLHLVKWQPIGPYYLLLLVASSIMVLGILIVWVFQLFSNPKKMP